MSLRERAQLSGAAQDRLELWFTLAAFADTNPATILEIGVFTGGLTATLRETFPDARIVGVEMYPHQLKYHDFTLIEGNSRHPYVIDEVEKFAPFDCIMIDGGHQLDEIRADWGTYVPMLRDGGVVAVHDAQFHHSTIEVWKFLPEIDHLDHVDVWSGKEPGLYQGQGVRLVWP